MSDWWNDLEEESDCEPGSVPGPLYDTLEERQEAYGEPIAPAECPHGNELGECDRCDFEGDIAFDAERERRLR